MDLRPIIKEQREELENIEKREKIISRQYLSEAKNSLKHPNILAVIGVRRCGKSVFSYLIAKDGKMGYVNFDDERLSDIEAKDLNRVLEAFYDLYGDVDYVILDEIQNIEKWELFVNRLRRTKRVVITGSNSNMLSSELSTNITGRYIDIHLFPFSFREFLDFKGFNTSKAYTTREKVGILKLLGEYSELGGFPEAYKFGKAMLTRIYNDIITKDILLRHKVRKLEDLRNLAKHLITNFSREIVYSRLSKTLGVKHVSTISNWVSYLEESFLIFKLEKFDFKLRQQFLSPKKIYCIDTGLVNAVSFMTSENIGRIMENQVAIELWRRKSTGFGEVYYWKDYQHHEVDFVLKEGLKVKQLIQVTYASAKDEIEEREVKSLLKASKELKCRNLSVITWDYEDEKNVKGSKVKFVPLWKWLLE